MKFQAELFEKYNKSTPRYTSYPPANYFKDLVDYNVVTDAIKDSNNSNPKNISIYIHIPFCHQLCLYCGCNTIITSIASKMTDYVDTLIKEIKMMSSLLYSDRKISQIHWGGGTPNYLPIEEIQRIMGKFRDEFNFISNPEIAMECHPAHLTKEYIDELVILGFNRLSFGIQDFSDEVLETVHREKPLLPIEEVVNHIKSHKNLSLNLDFIYGLPFQNVESYKNTIEKAAALEADRLAVFSYAHVPWVKKQQVKLEQYKLPSAKEKIALFQTAYDILWNKGYTIIGLDHFAKPDDELAVALKNKDLHRNFQGYCTRQTTGQVYALGVSGISQMENAYLQNTKSIKKYTEAINAGVFPIEKFYLVTKEEKIVREIIEQIMCNMEVNLNNVAQMFDISLTDLHKIIQLDTDAIEEFKAEGFITFINDKLELSSKGQFFMRNIAAAFDPNMRNNTDKKFSKAL